ncbi:MAG TPA: 4-hydroxy-tetrahydrodipicolinate reductase [Caulobacteraceae bacterium]|jgi:4-hydroxy-tetrahydrodipicolinate reductase|nr:4-hydroxy-tetrahydrodipicolinate reductase [Caulobacteraceae bacterium]
MNKVLQLGIAGALGRMGTAVAAAAGARRDVAVAARFDRQPGPGLTDRTGALARAEVVIDFTSGAASAELATLAAKNGGPALVIGTTGLSPDQDRAVVAAAERVAILRSGNFSLGVNMLLGLVAKAAASLSADYDIEVFEAHHRRKIDAPSGTALMLGQAAAKGRGVVLEDVAVRVRDGVTGPRPEGAIGFSVMRGGGIIGEHSVVFAAEDEILTLSHSALDRDLFARGAVAAALWVRGRPPGLYDMQDVLGLR